MPKQADHPVVQYLNIAKSAWDRLEADITITPRIGSVLREAGFVNVECKKFKVPLGTWPKDLFV
jgi:hypothetical protein